MNHAITAINKAGLADQPRSTILTGPPEPELKFEEPQDAEELAALNLEDTIRNINSTIRNSLYR